MFGSCLPILLRDTPPLQEMTCPESERRGQLSSFIGYSRQEFKEETRVPSLIFIPRIAFVFAVANFILHDSAVVQLLEITLHLAVVLPNPKIIGQVHSHHTRFNRRLALGAVGKCFEEASAKKQTDACILSHFRNAVFRGDRRHFEYRMATNGATGAAIPSHGVLPGLISKKKNGVVRPVSDSVQVVGIANPCVDIGIRRAPFSTPRANPTRGAVVLCPRLGTVWDHMLIVRRQGEKDAI